MEQIKLPRVKILQLLELIEQSDRNITHLLETGSNSNSFAIRQEKYLLERYCNELNELVEKNYHEIEIKVMFKTSKAA
jgi:hypothetical protein